MVCLCCWIVRFDCFDFVIMLVAMVGFVLTGCMGTFELDFVIMVFIVWFDDWLV